MSKKEAIVFTLVTLRDVLPFILVSQGLKKRGYYVTILTCKTFEQHVMDAGLKFHSIATVESFVLVK